MTYGSALTWINSFTLGEASLVTIFSSGSSTRVSLGERRFGSFMALRPVTDRIDADGSQDEMLRTIRFCRREWVLVGRGSIDQPLGTILKADRVR